MKRENENDKCYLEHIWVKTQRMWVWLNSGYRQLRMDDGRFAMARADEPARWAKEQMFEWRGQVIQKWYFSHDESVASVEVKW